MTFYPTQTMRLAFVVQRYGEEVNGGAELLCRWVAERMHKYFSVDVLTTCALDYLTWENYFPAGTITINSIPVHRFPTDHPRNMKIFNSFARKLFTDQQRSLVDELNWVQLQGPYSSALSSYIKEHEDRYDLFIFVTYSYLTTFLGLQLVPQKSLLIPAAHDEPHFYLNAFQPIFHLPQGIVYNTEEERRLVHRQWHNAHVPFCVAGAGIDDITEGREQSAADVCRKTSLSNDLIRSDSDFPKPYLLYFGRIDIMKGCQELIAYFLRYLDERETDMNLVLVGKQNMDIPNHPRIHTPGFVANEQKKNAIQHATVVVNSSEYESLSLMVLEAWQQEIPVLVNGSSDVLVEHCVKSNGGLYYTNYEEFALCLDLLLSNEKLRHVMGTYGKNYVEQYYSWDSIEKTYVDFITQIGNS